MARGGFLITAIEAAAHLGISFGRFKVAVMRGMGLDPKRKPNGNEAKPVVGGWSARSAKYRANDVKRMHENYPFRSDRAPDHGWFRTVASGPAHMARKPIPTPVSHRQLTAESVPAVAGRSAARSPKSPARAPAARQKQAIPKPTGKVFDWLL
jgi:hypothetical protein